MSANNDNAMTRFLFAILRQKNLKDIDWNQVAHDPILSQEITNGHAARMRYSRFRSAMLGLEPTRRNRTGPPRSRVSKTTKKDLKGKKDEHIKSETASESPAPQESIETPAPRIKQESSPFSFESRLTPRLTPGPSPMSIGPTMPATPVHSGVIQPRLLTPCGDGDLFTPSPTMTSSPASEMFNSQNSFDFRGSPCPDHNDPSWAHGPQYNSFATTYPFGYGPGSYEHPHMHHHSPMDLELRSQTVESDRDYINVKQEDWDQYN
ncbi:hypothetical protein F4677DRAFT_127079 [Hypoxylon crocopeplum]|nr:hypothetical protein F4677DRAFT_127079 [Hypoxylon crocopeplum]